MKRNKKNKLLNDRLIYLLNTNTHYTKHYHIHLHRHHKTVHIIETAIGWVDNNNWACVVT